MNSLLEKFHELKIFTLDDAVHVVKSKPYAMAVLRRYIDDSLVAKIRRNLYAVTNMATKHVEASRFEIGTALNSSAYISYHSALEFYGMANQVFNEVYVSSEKRFSDFEFDGITYRYAMSPVSLGVDTPVMSEGIRVTSIERTVVDCIDRVDKCGGTEEMLHCFMMLTYLNEARLIEVMEHYDKATLYKKVGFVLERFQKQLKMNDSFFDLCKGRAVVGSKVLASSEQCTEYSKRWNLFYPDTFLTVIEDNHHESI